MSENIRLATLADIDQLNFLVNSAYRGETSLKGWTTEAHLLGGIRINEKQLTNLINDQNAELWLYENDGLIIGCVNLIKKAEVLYLGMLTVSPLHQGMGIGKKLLYYADQRARQLHIGKIEMMVISKRNELIAWYVKHGYVQTTETRPFPMNDPEFGEPKTDLEFSVLEKII